MCNVLIFNYLDVVEFYIKRRLSFSVSCQVLIQFLTVLPLNDGVMHIATQRPPYYLFIYLFIFLQNIPHHDPFY